uniref:Uncharacterized protein n=1 Tax=Plectus sambesii TaxID=2011161 RepID=A0A914XPL8_9BILA
MTQSKIVAIDLGAYEMRISAVVNRQPTLLPLKNRKQKCSSTVAVKEGTVAVGDSAINNPPDAIAFGACRANGPPTSEVWFNQPNNGIYTFPSRPDDQWYRQQIIAELLKEAVIYASTYLKQKIDRVMITVPDNAGQHHRLLLLQAAEIAELNVVQLINQSTAAAAWYWTATNQISEHNALFVNFGASNISATVTVKSSDHIQPVSAAGDTTLGGEELTQQLMRYFLGKIDQKYIDKKKFIKQLRQDCEKAINELSASLEANVDVTFFDDLIYNEMLSRQQFESVCQTQFSKVNQIVNDAVRDFHKWAKENDKEPRIHRVFLFGGSSQNVVVAKIAEQALGPNNGDYQMEMSVIPEDAVALGAALLADLHGDPVRSKAIPNCVLEPLYCEVHGVGVRIAEIGDYLPIAYGRHPLITLPNPASLDFETVVVAGTVLLNESQISTLQKKSGRSVADQQQCVRLLAQLVKYFTNEERALSEPLTECAEGLAHAITDYIADAFESVIHHNASSVRFIG